MKRISLFLLASAGAAFSTAADTNLEARVKMLEDRLAAVESGSAASLEGEWKNVFVFDTPDNDFKLQIGGRTQLDAAFFDADDALIEEAGPFTDGVKFRRVRLYVRGTLYDNLDFITEYDFASDGFASTYIGLKNIPVIGNIRVGHQIEPYGLEELVSNNRITFLERASVAAFDPVFNIGLMAFNTAADKRMTWAAGVFKDTDSKGTSVSNEAWALTARLTGLPYISGDGRQYVHLGVAGSRRNFDDNTYRIRTRPGSALAPYTVDTGSIRAETVDLLGLESIVTLGRFSIQGEWMQSSVERKASAESPDGDLTFETYYVEASCFLTGEHRPYAKSSGSIGRIIPLENATGKTWGSGAWEVAGRYDFIDLNDADIAGGEQEAVTLGLNWYLNPNSRVMFNYIMADVESAGGVDIFTMRFQVDL